MVVVVDQAIEIGQDPLHPHGLLDGVQPERRHRLERHGGEHTQCTESYTGSGEQLGVLFGEHSMTVPSPEMTRQPSTRAEGVG